MPEQNAIICPICGAKMMETQDKWEHPGKQLYSCNNCGKELIGQDLKEEE